MQLLNANSEAFINHLQLFRDQFKLNCMCKILINAISLSCKDFLLLSKLPVVVTIQKEAHERNLIVIN